MSFEFSPTKEIRSAVVDAMDGTILDAFSCTNGVFSPVESSEFARIKGITQDSSHLIPLSYFINTTPLDFGRAGEQPDQIRKDTDILLEVHGHTVAIGTPRPTNKEEIHMITDAIHKTYGADFTNYTIYHITN